MSGLKTVYRIPGDLSRLRNLASGNKGNARFQGWAQLGQTTLSLARAACHPAQSARTKQNMAAFRILSDKSLLAIAAEKPLSIRELLEIPGVGARVAEQYGAQIFRILERAGS